MIQIRILIPPHWILLVPTQSTLHLQSLIVNVLFSFLFVSLHPEVEGSHGNDGLLLGRPLEEPDQPIADKSLLEIVDGIVMMYNLSVHQQLGKVSLCLYSSLLFYTVSQSCWEVVGIAGKCWEVLGSTGKYWEVLGSSGRHSLIGLNPQQLCPPSVVRRPSE